MGGGDLKVFGLGTVDDMVWGDGMDYEERMVRDGWGFGEHRWLKVENGVKDMGEAVSWESKMQRRTNRR